MDEKPHETPDVSPAPTSESVERLIRRVREERTEELMRRIRVSQPFRGQRLS